jgi:hypothetical protein
VTVALTTMLEGAPGDVDAFLSFHRNAGVDVVVVGGDPSGERGEILSAEKWAGYVVRAAAATHTELARIAVDEHGADWIVPASSDQLWWPRGESLSDVLAVIPPRYGVVQALVRTFVAGGATPETRTIRATLLGPDGSGGVEPRELLRPVLRAGPNMVVDDADWTLSGRRVPLRAWYPIEVLRSPASAPVLDRSRVDAGLADGSLVVDTRLSDALREPDSLSFAVPTIVDDASYAVECAAVGEVDLVRLDRQIRELELRIAELEARFWPTVRRSLRRLARRPS